MSRIPRELPPPYIVFAPWTELGGLRKLVLKMRYIWNMRCPV